MQGGEGSYYCPNTHINFREYQIDWNQVKMANYSSRYIIFPAFGATIGFFMGSSTGLAFGGDAVNGGVIFGLIGAVIGFLIASSAYSSNSASETLDQSPENENSDAISANLESSTPADDSHQLAESAYSLLETAINIAGSLWNLEMVLLKKIGLMPYFVRMPWIFLVVGFSFLALLFPIGIIFALTAFAAIHFQASSKNEFSVRIPKKSS